MFFHSFMNLIHCLYTMNSLTFTLSFTLSSFCLFLQSRKRKKEFFERRNSIRHSSRLARSSGLWLGLWGCGVVEKGVDVCGCGCVVVGEVVGVCG